MGKKTTKTSSTSTPWAPAQPMLLGAGQDITNTVHNNAGNLQNQENQLNGMLPGLQAQAQGVAGQMQPGMNYLNGVMGGQYLNSNPYTQGLMQQAGNDAANHMNSTYSLAGRTGSGAAQSNLARGVDYAENQVGFQNYQNERGLQNQAAGLLPGMAQGQFSGYQPYLQATQLAGQLPYYGTTALGGIGGLYGGYGTTTGTQPGGWGRDLLNAGAAAGSAAIMASDRRLKTNIEKLGEYPDGLGIYSWNWRADPKGEKVRGVLADEVKALRPHAFVENYNGSGFDAVNYGAL